MNVELLQKVKEWILENPYHLDMGVGIERDRICGTVACIAGTVCMLSAPVSVEEILESSLPLEFWSEKALSWSEKVVLLEGGRWAVVQAKAMRLLKIADDWTAERLFHVDRWVGDYSHRYREAKTCQERAQVVADYIDYYIAFLEEGAIAI